MRAMITRNHVHEALACLYDPTDLAQTDLAALLPNAREREDPKARGQALRRLLLDTIELLRPTGRAAPSASQYRAYECITMRYFSAMPVEEIAEELALSPRQVYRDLRWGEERLAELLNRRCAETQERHQADFLSQEIAALVGKPESVDLVELVRSAISTLSPLAESRGIALGYQVPAAGVSVTATPGVLREIIVQVLSALVQSACGGRTQISLVLEDKIAVLSIPVSSADELARKDLLQSALRLAQAQNVTHKFVQTSQGMVLRLLLPCTAQHQVLIVEDNPAAFTLYQRYLANTEWEPLLAPHPRLAGDLALARKADAIILDIMMPEADGWQVLQALKLDQRCCDIPVIVCSVVDDPELCLALGASIYLTKPVSRLALLQALGQVIQE